MSTRRTPGSGMSTRRITRASASNISPRESSVSVPVQEGIAPETRHEERSRKHAREDEEEDSAPTIEEGEAPTGDEAVSAPVEEGTGLEMQHDENSRKRAREDEEEEASVPAIKKGKGKALAGDEAVSAPVKKGTRPEMRHEECSRKRAREDKEEASAPAIKKVWPWSPVSATSILQVQGKGKAPAGDEDYDYGLDNILDVWTLISEENGIKSSNGIFLRLHETFWGTPLWTEKRISRPSGLWFPNSEGNMVEDIPMDLEIANIPPQLLSNTGGKLMIREEYRKCYEILSATGFTDGVVVTGQPGIGKSVFLYHCLICRLSQGQPTVFYSGFGSLLLFNNRGVYRCLDTGAYDPGVPSGTWALVDSTDAPDSPPWFLTNPNSPFFVVQATSPDVRRYKKWRKQKNAIILYMNPWSWGELWACSDLQNFPRGAPMAQELHSIFEKYGPTPRLVYHLVSRPEKVEMHEQELQGAARRLPLQDLQKLVETDGGDIVDTSIGDLSHSLFMVKPRDPETRHLFVHDVPTVHLMDIILQQMYTTFTDAAELLYCIFQHNSPTSAAAGMLFENSSLRVLARHGRDAPKEFEMTQMLGKNTSSSQSGPRRQFDTDETIQAVKGIFLASHRTIREYRDHELDALALANDTFYVPLRSTNPTFDFFTVNQGILYAFQATTAAVHTVKEAGLIKLRNITEKNQITGRWKWVFVIPINNVVRCHVPENWTHKLELYTLPLDVSPVHTL